MADRHCRCVSQRNLRGITVEELSWQSTRLKSVGSPDRRRSRPPEISIARAIEPEFLAQPLLHVCRLVQIHIQMPIHGR